MVRSLFLTIKEDGTQLQTFEKDDNFQFKMNELLPRQLQYLFPMVPLDHSNGRSHDQRTALIQANTLHAP